MPGWIFLDFDGVLNSDVFYTRNKKASEIGDVDPRAVKCLNALIEKTGAKVIISSNWRHDMSLDELREVLTKRGFKHPKKVVGKTPDLGEKAVRGYEILAFLRKRNALKAPFVVLDDNDDMDGVEDAFIRTSPKAGLSMAHVEKAVALLQRRGSKPVTAAPTKKAAKKRRKKILLPVLKPKRYTWSF